MSKAKDGWHVIYGRDVYVEGGKVVRGTKNDGQLPAYPYRSAKEGGWCREYGMSVSAFAAGVKRGTVELF